MKVAVIGCGSIGQRHLGNLLKMRRATVIACDADPQARRRVQQSFGVPVYERLDEALDGKPDAVFVCTPTHVHLEAALAAAKAGAHLFIEKPVAASLDGLDELQSVVRAQRRVALVGCNMRFHPGVAHLKKALDDGLLPRPTLIRAHFSHYLPNWRPGQDYRQLYSAKTEQGGGIILEVVHEIDYLRWFMGEPRSISAWGGRVSDLEITSEDIAVLWLQFEPAALAEVHVDYLRPLKSRGCELIGPDGIVRWVSEGKSPERVLVERYDAKAKRWKKLFAAKAYDANDMYLSELKHFFACVEGRAEPMLGLEDAQRVLGLALDAKRSVGAEGGLAAAGARHGRS